MATFLRIELPVTKFLFLGLLIAAVTLASGPALGNDPSSLGALGTGSSTYTSDEGPFGFKFSLQTVDGSPLNTVTDEYGETYAKLVIGQRYRVTGDVPLYLRRYLRFRTSTFTHLILEHQAVGEDTWDATHKFELPKGPSFDWTFTLPTRVASRGHWRLRTFNNEGGEGTEDPAVVSGLLGTTADAVVTWGLINDTKSDLYISYPTQQLANGNYCSMKFTLPAGQTSTTTFTNPPDWAALTFYATRVKSGVITDRYIMRWDHKVKGYNACSSDEAGLGVESGQTYYMRLTPRNLSSGFDAFVWRDDFPVCSAGWLTDFGYSMADHTFNFVETYLVDAAITFAAIGMGLSGNVVGAVAATTTVVDRVVKQYEELRPDLPSDCPE